MLSNLVTKTGQQLELASKYSEISGKRLNIKQPPSFVFDNYLIFGFQC